VDRTTGNLLHFSRRQLVFIRLRRLSFVRIRAFVHFRLLLADDQNITCFDHVPINYHVNDRTPLFQRSLQGTSTDRLKISWTSDQRSHL
jgi:hypothetical protein